MLARLLWMALVGFVAQLVDGATGMAYGVTSSSLLLAAGLAPAAVSASVHTAELLTTALAGLSHWRFGNVDPRLVLATALPGGLGAFVGATFLVGLPAHLARPYVSAFLFGLGGYILLRLVRQGGPAGPTGEPDRAGRLRTALPSRSPAAGLAVLGAVAGFADAVGGGGWGPLMTPLLLARRGADPRRIVGSVDSAEFAVALAAAAGFLAAGETHLVDGTWVGALLAGGALAAPMAARLVSMAPPRLLAAGVGGLVMLSSAPQVLALVGAGGAVRAATYGLILAGWALAGLKVSDRRQVRPGPRHVAALPVGQPGRGGRPSLPPGGP